MLVHKHPMKGTSLMSVNKNLVFSWAIFSNASPWLRLPGRQITHSSAINSTLWDIFLQPYCLLSEGGRRDSCNCLSDILVMPTLQHVSKLRHYATTQIRARICQAPFATPAISTLSRLWQTVASWAPLNFSSAICLLFSSILHFGNLFIERQ